MNISVVQKGSDYSKKGRMNSSLRIKSNITFIWNLCQCQKVRRYESFKIVKGDVKKEIWNQLTTVATDSRHLVDKTLNITFYNIKNLCSDKKNISDYQGHRQKEMLKKMKEINISMSLLQF
ncbi:CLUMA_CG005820, isoform A [Clunio marinus]|uniref:CLUMA_CG005820, isoform A n=1 Tax=Clunio marinus TaxID=568069 RepID=A0A1J1HXC7_9DIPT|nr:CLUMA_CG005820, isoform A [Clunio marinus]